MSQEYKIGAKVKILESQRAEHWNIVGETGELIGVNSIFLKIRVNERTVNLLKNEVEFLLEDPFTPENLIIFSPTFNQEEIKCGSLANIDKGYLKLQGVVTEVTPYKVTLSYYDPLGNNQVSQETIHIKDVTNGTQLITVIKQAIPLPDDLVVH